MEQEIKTINITLPAVSPLESAKIRLSNKFNRDTLFASLYPKKRKEKPSNEIGSISSYIAGFPNTLTIEQLKEEVTQNGKSFIGCIFLDMNFYKRIYGSVTLPALIEQIKDNAYLLWARYNVPYIQSTVIENHLPDEYNGLSNETRILKKYFILLSTFGLDVDKKLNDKGEDITPEYGKMYEEVRQRIIDLDLNTLFAYKTFSDPVKGERFRVIFKTDVPIFSWDLAHAIYYGLVEIFGGYMDENCTNVNRIFHR